MDNIRYNKFVDEVMNPNHLNSAYYLGRLMELINAWKPMSLQEWENYYCSWAVESGQSKMITQAIDKALIISYNKGMDYTREEIQAIFRRRSVEDTFKGRQRELDCATELREMGFTVETVNDELDRKYGVDLMLYNGQELIAGIQVKGEGYFYNYNNRERDEINPKKYKMFKEDYGVSVIEVGLNGNNKIKINKQKVYNLQEQC